MYVDDLVSGSNTIEEVESLNKNPLSYFEKVDLICISGTQIYRHYNLPIQSQLTYAKEKFKNTADLTKILGVPWYKNRDNLSTVVP